MFDTSLSGAFRDFDLQGALLGLREQVLVQVKEALITQEGPALPQDSEDMLKGQISDLAKNNNPIHTLIGQSPPVRGNPNLTSQVQHSRVTSCMSSMLILRYVQVNLTITDTIMSPIQLYSLARYVLCLQSFL